MKKTALIMIVALAISVFANAQTRVEIKSADLPKAITENVAKDFNGFAILNAFKVNANNQSTYELIVLKGVDKERLEYSSAGAFVKKTAIASKPIAASKPAATTKSVPAAKPAATTKPEPVKK
jgi:hypothetical protein